jgi:hypothetical protein
MENLTHYQNLVKQFMTEFAAIVNKKYTPNLYTPVIFDDEHSQYIMLRVGWLKQEHVHRTLLHVCLRDGHFWIEEDWTEEGIATYLLSKGVPRENIVLAFHPPEMRPLTDFAVA